MADYIGRDVIGAVLLLNFTCISGWQHKYRKCALQALLAILDSPLNKAGVVKVWKPLPALQVEYDGNS